MVAIRVEISTKSNSLKMMKGEIIGYVVVTLLRFMRFLFKLRDAIFLTIEIYDVILLTIGLYDAILLTTNAR